MSDNNGCGAGFALLAIMVVFVVAMAIGGPVITGGGLSWDNSAAIARTNARLEQERLRQAAETARVREREETARIMSDNMRDTMQWIVVGGVVVGAIGLAAWAIQRSVEAWAARPHRPAAAQRIEVRISYDQARLLAQPHLLALPGSTMEWIDGAFIDGAWVEGWAVVDDVREIVRPLELTDSQRIV
ncbi:MAG: hypothetical protein KAX65_07750 [Caldilineaceae bacterium]|nr:hypothetical protein [Caldilineaceae bacterium]